MIDIAICDDIFIFTLQIKNMLEESELEDVISIDTFVDGEELCKSAINKRYDILMMDIDLAKEEDGKNGMEISDNIKAMYPDVIVIFFTAYMSYRSDLLNFEPFRFLKKPLMKDEVIKAVNDAIERICGWKNNFFRFKKEGEQIQIKLTKIILFESFRPYIHIKTLDGEERFRGKMDDIEKEVESISNGFIRVNKSTLVNKEYIERCSTKEVVMTNGDVVSVGRKYIGNISKFVLDI